MHFSISASERYARAVRVACVVALGIMLWLPASIQLFATHEAESQSEKRVLDPLPRWPARWRDVPLFTLYLDRYLRDRFGLREPLVTGWNLLRFALRDDPRVAAGSAGWLYYSNFWPERSRPGACDQAMQYARLLSGALERLAGQAGTYGVRVLFALAPDKESIYPEFLPEGAPAPCLAREQLLSALRVRGAVETLDLHALLADAKLREQVYFKTDTHWTDDGLWLVSRALLDASCPGAQPCSRLPVPASAPARMSGDLAHLLGLGSLLREDYRTLRVPAYAHVSEDRELAFHFSFPQREGRSLYVVGDSFTKLALRFLAADTSVSRLSWYFHRDGTLDMSALIREKPDVLLIVIAERELYRGRVPKAMAARLSGTSL